MTAIVQGATQYQVTRIHLPAQRHCDDGGCPCGLPPAGAVPLEVTGVRERGQRITGWADGQCVAVITWRGWDGRARPADAGEIQTYTAIVRSEQPALGFLSNIGEYPNVELVGAWLVSVSSCRA